jgi:hypothetical protein
VARQTDPVDPHQPAVVGDILEISPVAGRELILPDLGIAEIVLQLGSQAAAERLAIACRQLDVRDALRDAVRYDFWSGLAADERESGEAPPLAPAGERCFDRTAIISAD